MLETYRKYSILVEEKIIIKNKNGEKILDQEYIVEKNIALGLARRFVDVDIEENIKQTIENVKELESDIYNSLM